LVRLRLAVRLVPAQTTVRPVRQGTSHGLAHQLCGLRLAVALVLAERTLLLVAAVLAAQA
jgi:hypothetical protein